MKRLCHLINFIKSILTRFIASVEVLQTHDTTVSSVSSRVVWTGADSGFCAGGVQNFARALAQNSDFLVDSLWLQYYGSLWLQYYGK